MLVYPDDVTLYGTVTWFYLLNAMRIGAAVGVADVCNYYLQFVDVVYIL